MNTINSVWDKIQKRHWKQCWNWTGHKSKGYGRLDIGGLQGVYAHRAAYISANPNCGLSLRDESDKEKCILHRCDNPSCCNPRHLFIGSHDENMADKAKKGRAKIWAHSTETPRAKLTAEDVFWMRMQKKHGATKKALAMLYDVSTATVSGALYGRHYRDVA
jgi:hypothetical protein